MVLEKEEIEKKKKDLKNNIKEFVLVNVKEKIENFDWYCEDKKRSKTKDKK